MTKKKLPSPTKGPWFARKGDVMNPERSWGIVRPLNKRECRDVDGDLSCYGGRSEVIAEVYAASGGRDEADAYLLAAAWQMKKDIDAFIEHMDGCESEEQAAEIAQDMYVLFKQSQKLAEGKAK